MKKKFIYLIALSFFVIAACTTESGKREKLISVVFESEDAKFETKVGRELVIIPDVADAIDPFYVWKSGGKIIGREKDVTFLSKTAGEHKLLFRVDAVNGSYMQEVTVSVLERTPPVVTLPSENNIISAVTGKDLEIVPNVLHSEGATYKWFLEKTEVGTESKFVFNKKELGDYRLVLVVVNEDGEGRAEAVVRVGEVPELKIEFEHSEIYVPAGRDIVLAPFISYATDATVYEWSVDGEVKSDAKGNMLRLSGLKAGNYTIKVKGVEKEFSSTAEVKVVCTAGEDSNFRPSTAQSKESQISVLDFVAAPGQFVNQGFIASTQEEANKWAMERMESSAYVSLGGFGGYIVVGFDHSIENKSGYDLAIRGNAFKNSSEPGIVWVMQDENGNGKPDDTWYELKGSETGKSTTIQQYAVTYFKPSDESANIRWSDNKGGAGYLTANGSKYPSWIKSSSITLKGTNLKAQNEDTSGNGTYWENRDYEWGYVDNFGKDYTNNETLLDIDNAIYPDGTKVNLKYIDFVKVQNGIRAESGWLGEISTEVFGFRDMNLNK